MLCIDPSSGSARYRSRRKGAEDASDTSGSMPGWALFERGELVASGIVEIPGLHREAPYRLQDLARLLKDFDTPDLLVVEKVSKRVSLVQSAGAIFASVLSPRIIQIHPRSWQAWVRPDQWTRATKSDENDAKGMGYALINMLQQDPSGPAVTKNKETSDDTDDN